MRKTLDYLVPGTRTDKVGQRDAGKTFRLTEMPAYQAHMWAVRLALGGGSHLDVNGFSVEALSAAGIRAVFSMPEAQAKPLLDEAMACVQYVGSAGAVTAILPGEGSQIEDPHTYFQLYMKLFELHTGFSLPVAIPTSG